MSTAHHERKLHDCETLTYADFKARFEKAVAEADQDTLDELECCFVVGIFPIKRICHVRNLQL